MQTKEQEVKVFEQVDIAYFKKTSLFRNTIENIRPEIDSFTLGNLTCFVDGAHPNAANYNRVKGLTEHEIDRAESVIKTYQSQGVIMPSFDMLNTEINPQTTNFLIANGCLCLSNYQRLYMDLRPYHEKKKGEFLLKDAEKSKPEVYFESIHKERILSTRLVKSQEDLVAFERLFLKNEGFFQCYKMPEFNNYVTLVDGAVAGIASLFVEGKVGYLLDDFTKPAFRNLGIQQALINARIYHSRLMGLEYLYTDVDLRSISQLNYEKCGLKPLITKSIWLSL